MWTIFLSLFFPLLFSCTKEVPKNEPVKVVFKISAGSISSLGGGITIYGRNAAGKGFAQSFNPALGAPSIELPAGTWEFYAFGLIGAGPLSGIPRCGQQTGVQIVGGAPSSVSMTLNAANCAGAYFTGGLDGAGAVKNWIFLSCMDLTNLSDSSTNCASAMGNLQSYKVQVMNFPLQTLGAIPAGVGPGLTSKCLFASAQGTAVDTGLRLPFTTNPTFLSYRIMAYSDSSCGTFVRNFDLTGKLTTSDAASQFIASSANNMSFFFKADVNGLALFDYAYFDLSVFK